MDLDDHYFDHDADIGIIGRGPTLETCFADIAQALFALQGDLSAVKPTKTIYVEFEESDVELALVTWLNLLIGKSQIENLLFSKFTIKRENHHWQGEASGEAWNDKIERGIDVKGATLTMLSVKQCGTLWEARCVVDV